MQALPPEAYEALSEAVRAVVERDQERLAAIAPDMGDLYVWTREYGSHGVDLVLPPGEPDTWEIDAMDTVDGTKHVEVAMWTRQEGRSDLTLELTLSPGDGRSWQVRILNLHVL